jgi:hypothetical protein
MAARKELKAWWQRGGRCRGDEYPLHIQSGREAELSEHRRQHGAGSLACGDDTHLPDHPEPDAQALGAGMTEQKRALASGGIQNLQRTADRPLNAAVG